MRLFTQAFMTRDTHPTSHLQFLDQWNIKVCQWNNSLVIETHANSLWHSFILSFNHSTISYSSPRQVCTLGTTCPSLAQMEHQILPGNDGKMSKKVDLIQIHVPRIWWIQRYGQQTQHRPIDREFNVQGFERASSFLICFNRWT